MLFLCLNGNKYNYTIKWGEKIGFIIQSENCGKKDKIDSPNTYMK